MEVEEVEELKERVEEKLKVEGIKVEGIDPLKYSC